MIKKIVIVGGGSSGWMTASYLAKALKDVESIQVVESSRIQTVGVGEATFSTIKLFFDFLGLRERDWMPHCSAAYKLAIRFVNWTKAKGHFYHPFQRYETACGASAGEWWLKLKRDEEPFDYACFSIPWLCDAKRSPRHLDGTVFDDAVRNFYMDGSPPPNTVMSDHKVQYPYAYHFNAAELATFLQRYAVGLGVERIVDDVVEVPLTETGAIASIRTKEHGTITADLFVDCTGFRGLLINQALGEPFISFGDNLLNDSAVAIQVPRDIEKDGLRPYTTATAHNAGWSWNIPLYGRDGTGYVYCSKFIDKDEAEREFREFLGPAAKESTANHIKMRIGRCRNSWVKNCVAIGLSSGFVEPLESTGIFFIQHGIEELVNHIPDSNQCDENMIASYNKAVAECIDGVREFLTLHFFASDRDDTPFWRATKEVAVPPGLQERMKIWKARLPGMRNVYPNYHGFDPYSWSVMLLGLNCQPVSSPPLLDHLDESKAHEMFDRIRKQSMRLVETLPSQYEYLTQMRSLGA
jgi:tryptophan halogenase